MLTLVTYNLLISAVLVVSGAVGFADGERSRLQMMSLTCGEGWVSGGVCVHVSVLECV